MNNFSIKKLRISNFSLAFQIILINLFVIVISFLIFGAFNFYSISQSLNLKDTTTQLNNLNDKLSKSIISGAIKIPLYSTEEKVLVQSNREELDPYSSQVILDIYKNIDSNIKIYDTKLSLFANSQDFFKISIKESDISNVNKISIYKKFNDYYTKEFINYWHLYNKKRYQKYLVPRFNEIIKITDVIKYQKKMIFYYVDENNAIYIKIINPLIKNGDIHGVVVLTSSLSNADKIISDLTSNLLNNLLITMLIVTLLSTIFARSIARPIKRLSDITKHYQMYKTLKLSQQSFPKRGDEIGLLSKNLKEMSKNLLDRINELERFAADVAHELKNPLASIKSANEVLNKNNNEKTNNELMNIIDQDITRMDKLITDIANYTKTKAEIEKSEKLRVNIINLLKDIAEVYKNNKKNIKINLDFPEKHCVTFANYEKLAQVISIIMDNAISFTPNNLSILILFEIYEKNGLISIIDQGPGVKSKYKEKIFERFYTDRLHNNDLHSGLGLDIARNIIKTYHGKIYIGKKEIEGYNGACFIIELPIEEIKKL